MTDRGHRGRGRAANEFGGTPPLAGDDAQEREARSRQAAAPGNPGAGAAKTSEPSREGDAATARVVVTIGPSPFVVWADTWTRSRKGKTIYV